jgi:hypothetical protein
MPVLLYNKIYTDLHLCQFYYAIKYLLIYIYAKNNVHIWLISKILAPCIILFVLKFIGFTLSTSRHTLVIMSG